MMKLNIPLPGREYDIMIDSGLLDRAGEHCRAVLPLAAKLAVVTDSNVAPLYAERVKKSLEGAGFAVQVTVIPAGETSKSMAMLERLYDEFMAFGLTRTDAVVALGGGVVGDLAGFAAATILPPPRATTASVRVRPKDMNPSQSRDSCPAFLLCSPAGTVNSLASNPAAVRLWSRASP